MPLLLVPCRLLNVMFMSIRFTNLQFRAFFLLRIAAMEMFRKFTPHTQSNGVVTVVRPPASFFAAID